ncbi:ankyrin repeat domain-containing protein [Actinomadura sp. GTD37]|uniref:ankyrin repeat domain-containing protein n=1 Tax=Actinomadura sp. GTD37 TaxID=1778030 RepID=UPI0035C1DA2F
MFTDGVQKQIARLGGRLPEDFEPKEWMVSTPAGERRVPDWAQALFAVVFEAGDLRADDHSEYLVHFYETPIGPGYFKQKSQRAWHGVGQKGDYYWYVADLDDTSANPMVHKLDMEGGDGALDSGIRLSTLLAGLKVITPPGDGDRLALACSARDVAAATEELARGAGLGPLDDTGIAPLHLAVMSRSTDLVRLLLEAGADARAEIEHDTQTPWTYVDANAYGSGELWTRTTALHLALNGELAHRLYEDEPVDEIVRLLLDAGAAPDAIDGFGWTPMQLANASPQLVRLLLAAGANPNLTGALRPPLVSAAFRSNASEEVVRLLLAAGADANSVGKDGTALSVAAGNGSTTVLQLLLDAGAAPNRPDPQDCWTPGRTPLHRALGRKANVELLLAAGADPNARTADGFTSLITVLLGFHLADPVEMVTMLVQAGAEVCAAVDEATVQAYVAKQYKPKKPLADLTATTPLGIAKHLGMTRTAAYLTKQGAGG